MNKIVFLTTLLFLTASCTQGNIMLSGQNTGIWKDADGKTFEIQRNPNPKEAYDFTVTLIDAPKELQATMAGAFYVSDCQLTVNKAAGANTMMSYILPICVTLIYAFSGVTFASQLAGIHPLASIYGIVWSKSLPNLSTNKSLAIYVFNIAMIFILSFAASVFLMKKKTY